MALSKLDQLRADAELFTAGGKAARAAATAVVSQQPLSDSMLRKVQSCLAILQEAQDLCNAAAQELCPVPGFADQWSKLSAPHDVVKAAWHTVNCRLSQMRIRAERGQCPACGRKIAHDPSECAACGFSWTGELLA